MRYCENCGDQIEGRANKIFCSSVCKSQHFRANSAPAPAPVAEVPRRSMVPASVAPPALATRAAARPVPVSVPVPIEEEEEEEETLAEMIARVFVEHDDALAGVAAVQLTAQLDELHGRYNVSVRQFLKLSGRAVEVEELAHVLDAVEGVDAAYTHYPKAHLKGIKLAHAARLRLLEDMSDELRELVDEARPRSSWWSGQVQAPKPTEIEWETEFRDELLDSLYIVV